jgi:hypothetical protein
MGLIEQAQIDIREITSNLNDFGVAMKLIAPNLTELDLVGLHTKHHLGYDQDGKMVNTKNAHVSFSEDILVDASYPYRNASGEVNLKGHKVIVKDSTRNDVEYIIREWFPDETIGLIVCILGDYE